MNTYEQKKQAKIERLTARAEKKREFANANDLSLFGEEKSGIPLGQPILVGHHSERKHRAHLARIENKVRKGYEAAEYADELEKRVENIENRTAIDSDNPDAARLIQEKIDNLILSNEMSKKFNKILSKFETLDQVLEKFASSENVDEKYIFDCLKDRKHWFNSPNIRLHYFSTTNNTAEIRRLQIRLKDQAKIDEGFAPFEICIPTDGKITVEQSLIGVCLEGGQIQVEFKFKPSEETRNILKRAPIALKWSNYSKKWVRKHTATTATKRFRDELIIALKNAKA